LKVAVISGDPQFVVNLPLKYALEGQRCWVPDETCKEFSGQISKTILKPAQVDRFGNVTLRPSPSSGLLAVSWVGSAPGTPKLSQPGHIALL